MNDLGNVAGLASTQVGLQIKDYAMIGYFVAYLFYALHAFVLRKEWMGRLAVITLGAGWILHTLFLVSRGLYYYNQHKGFLLPATNMYEATSYFAWLVTLLYFILEIRLFKTRLYGVFALIIPLAALGFAAKSMGPDPRELMPSLKSYWLVFHITAMFISYSAFALAAVFGLLYLLRVRGWLPMKTFGEKLSLRSLDELSNRIIMVGVPVITLGIALGAFWADAAWGRYWGWDPKETWALGTWFVYIIYLHLRHRPGWIGYRSAVLACLGFTVVLVTFQGVNMLDNVFSLNSIHAYTMGAANVQKDIIGLGVMALPMILFAAMLFLPPPRGDLSESLLGDGDETLGTPVREALKGDTPGAANMQVPAPPAHKAGQDKDMDA